MVTDGAAGRVPFVCEACRGRATAVVRLQAGSRFSLGRGVPRLATLAQCPHCGHRWEQASREIRLRGWLLTLAGTAVMLVGFTTVLALGSDAGWAAGGLLALFGSLLAAMGPFTETIAVASADRLVAFEPCPVERSQHDGGAPQAIAVPQL